MFFGKKLHRLISFFLSFSLVFQTFSPVTIFAQEATQSADTLSEANPSEASALEEIPLLTPVETITPTPTEELLPIPEASPTPAVEPSPIASVSPTPNLEPQITVEPVVTPEVPTPVPTSKPLWVEVDTDTITTNDNVGEGIDYRFRDTGFLIRFTKINHPGKLTISQLKLTPEQMVQSGSLTDTAYEVTSEMENGSFLYDLTLPVPPDEADVEVEYANSPDNLDGAQTTPQTEEVRSDSVTIRGLDHFTIFFVTSGRDKATNGNACNSMSGNPCAFNAGEKTSLKYDDDNKLTITDYAPNPDETGFWPDLGYGSNRYVQFDFSPGLPSETTILNAYLKIVYQTNAVDSDQPFEARMRLLSPSVDISSIGPGLTANDQTYLIPLPASHLTRSKLNNLKARFFMFASPRDDEDGVWVSFDQVVLLVNYSPPTLSFDPPQNPTNDDTPTLTGTALSSGGSTIKNVEYRVDGGGWLPATPADGSFDTSSENFNLTPEPLADGEHLFEARALDSHDTFQTEMVSLSLTSDLIKPTAIISYSNIIPTNGNVIATLVPSETVTVDNNGGSISYTFESNGSFTFNFTDLAGNVGSTAATVENIDKTASTGNITIPVNGSYKNTKPTFRASASDANGIASVKFQYKPDAIPDFLDLNTDVTPNASGLYQASWSGVTLVNGTTYDLQIIITDGVGNQNTVGGVSFLYDTLLPGILYNNPPGGETVWYNTNPLFDIDFLYDEGGAPLDYAQYRLDGGSYKNIFTADRISDYAPDWGIASWATLTEGLHRLDIRLRDKAGNTNTDDFVEGTSGLNVGKDLTAPVITVPGNQTLEAESGAGAVYEFSPAPSASDDSGISGVACDYASGETFPIGTTTVTCEATDLAGNTGNASFVIAVEDNIKPTSIITVPDNNGTNSLIYSNSWDGSILGTAADGQSGLARVDLSIQRTSDGKYFDGVDWIEAEEDEPRVTVDGTVDWNYTLTSPAEDSYEIVSHAVDNAGNVEDSYKLTIVFDKTIPEVTLALDPATPDSGNNWYKTEPTITLTAVDDTVTDRIEYQWDSTSGAWTIYGLPFKTIGEGNHTLYYRAFDKAGNVSGIGIKNIKYDKTELTDAPLNVSVSPNPTSGTTAKVKWEAASDNVGIEKYEVNWSLDGTATSYTDTVGNEVREYEINKLDQEGKWNITITAFDYAGNKKSGSTELTVDRSSNSNVVNTLRLVGAPGVEPGTPAEGFTPEVKGAETSPTPTPTETSSVLGAVKDWDLPWWLIFLLIPSGGLLLWSLLRRS